MPQHGGRGVAGVEQVRVQLVEVFRSQPVDPVSPDPRDEVRADGGLVALQRPLPYAARRGAIVVSQCSSQVATVGVEVS
jgi:hypothetical protein